MNTQRGMRLHIGFFGKRNAGKSSLVNKISGQKLSIVSDIKGTTTDAVQKAMELLPVGPVLLIDTAGIDDEGDNKKLSEIEKEFIKKIKENNSKIISVINKTDLGELNDEDEEFLKNNTDKLLKTSAIKEDNFIFEFKKALVELSPDEFINQNVILSDIVKKDEICILVIPIDKEAPKGRIILPQVNTLRELLDNNSISVVCNEKELEKTLQILKTPPKLVVVDSQAFREVSKIVPDDIMLTSFSILFARLKGDLKSLYMGAKKIDDLKDNDKILVLESCTHHPVEDDIGRVKIPKLIREYTKKELIFEHFSGHDFPSNIKDYSLIIHCGACMTNRREILNRIEIANKNNVPMTNYGIAIAKATGILKRAIKPLLDD